MAFLFAPSANYIISATDATGQTETTIDADAPTMRLYNAGPSLVFVSWSRGQLDVSSSSYMLPLPVGAVEAFSKLGSDKIVAECATGGTATLYITVGLGE